MAAAVPAAAAAVGAIPPPGSPGFTCLRATSTPCAWRHAPERPTAGTATDQNNWLRSWTNELYLWYSEVTDRDPSLYSTVDYFPLLKTTATTASGQAKDKFHFTYDTEVWRSLSQGGVEAGYGAEFAILLASTTRTSTSHRRGLHRDGIPAASQLLRGDEILQVDGVDAVNGGTQANVNALNAGPVSVGHRAARTPSWCAEPMAPTAP